jgi:CheY-like chemotaxis protein
VDLLMPGMDGFEFLRRFRRLAGCELSPAIVWTMKDLTPEDNARLHRLAQAVVAKGEPPSGGLVDQLGVLLSRRPRHVGAP